MWLPVFGYDYNLSRVGWKPVQTWFVRELDSLINQHAGLRSPLHPPKVRRDLISTVLKVAFDEHKSDHAITMDLSRSAKSAAERRQE